MKSTFFFGIALVIVTGTSFLTSNSQKIINFDNAYDMQYYNELNLDSSYINLLDPRNLSENEIEEVFNSWSTFHQEIGGFLTENNFQWEVPDSTISIVNKIYFDKQGTIDYYGFKILNKSVTAEKKEEFKEILFAFSKNVKLDLNRKTKYAQCGKTKYLNY